MALKNKDGKFVCPICDKVFPTFQQADSCRDNHDVVYVPLEKSEIIRLLMFCQSGEIHLITPQIIYKLQRFVNRINKDDYNLPQM